MDNDGRSFCIVHISADSALEFRMKVFHLIVDASIDYYGDRGTGSLNF